MQGNVAAAKHQSWNALASIQASSQQLWRFAAAVLHVAVGAFCGLAWWDMEHLRNYTHKCIFGLQPSAGVARGVVVSETHSLQSSCSALCYNCTGAQPSFFAFVRGGGVHTVCVLGAYRSEHTRLRKPELSGVVCAASTTAPTPQDSPGDAAPVVAGGLSVHSCGAWDARRLEDAHIFQVLSNFVCLLFFCFSRGLAVGG